MVPGEGEVIVRPGVPRDGVLATRITTAIITATAHMAIRNPFPPFCPTDIALPRLSFLPTLSSVAKAVAGAPPSRLLCTRYLADGFAEGCREAREHEDGDADDCSGDGNGNRRGDGADDGLAARGGNGVAILFELDFFDDCVGDDIGHNADDGRNHKTGRQFHAKRKPVDAEDGKATPRMKKSFPGRFRERFNRFVAAGDEFDRDLGWGLGI
jgi:hypothetical protein